jgi:nucleoid-associated protein YgaU
MRAEVKVGLIVGAVAIAGAAIWWFSGNSDELGSIPFDKQSMDASSAPDTALAGDVSPTPSGPRRTVDPAANRRDRTSATPRPARRTEPPPTPREAETQLEQPPATARPGPEVTPPPTAPPDEPASSETPQQDSSAAPRPAETPGTPARRLEDNGEPSTRIDAPRLRETPAREPERPRSRLPEPAEMKTYTIQRADRLIDLAREEYGDGSLWKAIKAVNPGLDENRLIIGATIYIPTEADARRLVQAERDRQTPPPPTPRGEREEPASRQATYVVAPGDTLTKIARNVLNDGTRWREIFELNRDQLDSPDILRVGMELRLPPVESE